MRRASNQSQPFLKQLWLPYYLYQLSSKIMALQREVEVRKIASLTWYASIDNAFSDGDGRKSTCLGCF
jgi:hypothetical protein